MEVMRLEPLPVIRELLLRQQPANDSHRLFGTRQRLLDHDSVAALHETDSAGAKAKGAETTLREVVNTARAHGEECRRTRIAVDDRRAEADGLGLSRHDGENSESVFASLPR